MAATIREVLVDRLAQASVTLSGIGIDSLLIEQGLGDGAALYATAQIKPLKKALVVFLTGLLVTPNVAEGSLSITYDRVAVLSYVNNLRRELSMPPLNGPTLKDISYLL